MRTISPARVEADHDSRRSSGEIGLNRPRFVGDSTT